MTRSRLAPWFILAALALLFAASIRYSLGVLLRSRQPELALTFAPGNAGVLAAASSAVARSATASTSARARALRQAEAALAREPGNVMAAASIGLLSAFLGQQDKARKFFAYSSRRSRRDLLTQLWLIEDAVAQNNIPNALEHYDIALRTSANAPEILFPVLTSATSDPQIRRSLVMVLRRDPLWREAFEGYLANNTKDFLASTALFAALVRTGTPPARGSENALMSAMVTEGLVDDAWRYYRLRHPRDDPMQPRNSTFFPGGADGSPFDWGLVNDNGISSALGSDARGGILLFEVSPSISGIVTQQLQRLPTGRYRLSGRARVPQQAAAYVQWEVLCSDGRALGQVKMSASDEAPAAFGTSFEVPASGCPTQLLRLTVLPSDAISGISGAILDIRFTRTDAK